MSAVRFLHTGDWQLGMARHFLPQEAQERFNQARVDAIRTMGQIAKQENCQFLLVCGDTFESNLVDRRTVARALEAIGEVPVPVFITPGNHDPLNAASVYRSRIFMERKPAHLHILESSAPLKIRDGVELVGAPWLSKRPFANPIEEALRALTPANGILRICMGHGAVDALAPDPNLSGVIAIATLENALEKGLVHFVALGDRHSVTKVGTGDSIWYAGTPESTDFSEVRSGFALVVEVKTSDVKIKEVPIGEWRFIEHERVDMNSDQDVETFGLSLKNMKNKERTVLRLNLVGTLSLSMRGVLEQHFAAAKDVFGALDIREDSLLVVPDDTDFANLGYSGFAEKTVQHLRSKLGRGGDSETSARDALMLLLRLTQSAG